MRRAAPMAAARGGDDGRGGRIAALVVALVFLLLVGAFVGMAFLRHDEARLNPVGPVAVEPGAERGGVLFSGTASTWEVRGRIAIDAQRRAHIAFDLTSPTGQPAPAALAPALVLELPGRDLAPLQPRARRAAPGSYVAVASLPADGAWRLRIELPEIAAVLPFVVAE